MENLIDNDSLKILRFLYTLQHEVGIDVIHDNLQNMLSFTEVLSSIQYLEETKMIFKDTSHTTEKSPEKYSISRQGRAFIETERRHWSNRIIDHVAFPLVVAFFTALVTTLLTTMLLRK